MIFGLLLMKCFSKKAVLMGNVKGCIEWIGAKKSKAGYGVQVLKWGGQEGDWPQACLHDKAYDHQE